MRKPCHVCTTALAAIKLEMLELTPLLRVVNCVLIFKEFHKLTSNTVFMLIERMIQLPQENSIPGIVCILLERKRLSVIIFYESN